MKKYRSEKAILNLVELFETATISREAWKHAEHLTVALYYITNHDIETATDKMRSGILKLLREGFEVDLAKEMPYHETLTVFWMRTVSEFNASKNGDSLVNKANELADRFEDGCRSRLATCLWSPRSPRLAGTAFAKGSAERSPWSKASA